jgi:hypothetical protein
VVVAAAGGAGAGAYFFLTPSDPGDPKPVAQDVIAKVNAKDLEAVKAQLCVAKRSELSGQLDQLKGGSFQLKIDNVTARGSEADAKLSGSFTLNGATLPVAQSIRLVVEGGEWKVCSLGQ